MKVLALSSSRVGNGGFLEATIPLVEAFLENSSLHIAFLPFASVHRSYDEFGDMVKKAFSSLSYIIDTVNPGEATSIIENADAIMVGGGNTFKLLYEIYYHHLFELIQNKVTSGTPYVGWSAGANITGKTISTTNDMPIIQPKSFTAFGFLPFQINPHYINKKTKNHNGETRDQRIEEFLLLNPGVPVVGLPEGSSLMLEEEELHFVGDKKGVLFQCNTERQLQKIKISKGEDLSFLLK